MLFKNVTLSSDPAEVVTLSPFAFASCATNLRQGLSHSQLSTDHAYEPTPLAPEDTYIVSPLVGLPSTLST
jgi:hypothetical protein